jgi:hypothetical protein
VLRRSFLRSVVAVPAACLAQQPGGAPAPGPFKPAEPANSPIGVSRAIHPGRVAWARDAKATSWNTAAGNWWDDANTDQRAVDRMMSRLLLDVTGRGNEKQAWDALFRSFNETRKNGGSGYRPGEKIAIKINGNQDRGPDWANMVRPYGGDRRPQNGLPSPHAVFALVNQLITVAGVRGEDILVYEACAAHNVGQPIVGRIRANPDRNFQSVTFVAGADFGFGGRVPPVQDTENPIRFAGKDVPTGYLPKQVTEAKYLINFALLRAHTMAGVTLTGKNHFGSVYFPNNGGWLPRALHNYVQRTLPMGSYNPLVDLIGHPHLGGKTMLFMLDGLYTAAHNEGNVYKWESLGDQWTASMLMSQDPVALDSVGLDLLRSEPRAAEVRGTAENYLHEAALAGKPPSGTVYITAASLGVHEHWNNAAERKYSRNLGRKQGIELIKALA